MKKRIICVLSLLSLSGFVATAFRSLRYGVDFFGVAMFVILGVISLVLIINIFDDENY